MAGVIHTPSTAGYSYSNSFDVRIKLNTDPNLTPNPIRTLDRVPNPNRPTSQKKFAPGGSRTHDLRQNDIIPARALCLLS